MRSRKSCHAGGRAQLSLVTENHVCSKEAGSLGRGQVSEGFADHGKKYGLFS